MERIFYTSDLHFGHKNVIRFDERPFSTVEEMDDCLIENWNYTVQEQDHVYILGDIAFRSGDHPKWYLKRLKGRKHLIVGNHDGIILSDLGSRELFESIDQILTIQDGEHRVVLCHYPLTEWPYLEQGAYHLFGHIHNRQIESQFFMNSRERAINAGCMYHGYTPQTLKGLIQWKQSQKD